MLNTVKPVLKGTSILQIIPYKEHLYITVQIIPVLKGQSHFAH